MEEPPTIHVFATDGRTVIEPRGEHDISTVAELADELVRLDHSDSLVVDLSLTTFVDSTILSAVVHTASSRAVAGRDLITVAPTGSFARRLLDLSGVAPMLRPLEALDSAGRDATSAQQRRRHTRS